MFKFGLSGPYLLASSLYAPLYYIFDSLFGRPFFFFFVPGKRLNG